MTTSSKQHILVIGAGVTGLLIAQGLQQASIPFTVFEAEAGADVARSREWQMILHWALPLAMKLLPEHLAVQLKERASVDSSLDFDVYPNNILRFYNGVDGAILAELPIKNRCIRVARKKLRALCADGVEIKYGHILKAVRVDEDRGEVTAKFSNGHEATGTLLIGCDGAKSFVRHYLLGSAKASITPLDVSFWNVIVTYPDAERALHIRSAHPIFAMVARPGFFGFLGIYDVPDPEKPETWRFHLAISFPRDENVNAHTLSNAERHAVMKEKGAQLCEPFRTAILGIPEEVVIPTDDIGYWTAERWDTRGGLITLAGDAAHPMTPHRGQGCNNATQDAYNIVESIKRIDAGGDQHRLIQECSDEIVKRGAAETKLSLETAYAFLDWDKLQASPLFKHSLSARH